MRWDLRKNERDLSELQTLKTARHFVLMNFNLSGSTGVVRSLGWECSGMALRLGEGKGALQPRKGFK